jgi:putative transposase
MAENTQPGRARPPGGPERIPLDHNPPGRLARGAVYFVTICCEQRKINQLCLPSVSKVLFDAAKYYHHKGDWYLLTMLLMPDHLHALISVPAKTVLGAAVGNWKRYTSTRAAVVWQKNFFDRRLRSDESLEEKTAYIHANPIRAGLIKNNEVWPYQFAS